MKRRITKEEAWPDQDQWKPLPSNPAINLGEEVINTVILHLSVCLSKEGEKRWHEKCLSYWTQTFWWRARELNISLYLPRQQRGNQAGGCGQKMAEMKNTPKKIPEQMLMAVWWSTSRDTPHTFFKQQLYESFTVCVRVHVCCKLYNLI